MSSGRIARISLRVESLRQAENLYTRLFGLTVLQREGTTEEGDYFLSGRVDWRDLASQDMMLQRSVLQGEGFCLTLHLDTMEATSGGRLDRIGLSLEQEDFRRLWGQVEDLGCHIEEAGDQSLVFDDPYGLRWEVLTE